MKQIFNISHPSYSHETKVFLGDDLLYSDHLITSLHSQKRRLVIITDSTVETLYAMKLQEHLRSNGLVASLLSYPGGESHKTRETKQMLEDGLLAQRMGRDTLLIVMGGGITCDLGGYLASTFCRGIPYILIPTTLLAMVDASIGGKTGVNTPSGKNLIGTFYPPTGVFIDLQVLKTLPERERRTGCAEIIKHGLIGSKELFYLMKEDAPRFASFDTQFFMRMIGLSVQYKKEIVEQDPFDRGVRSALNFGHTIGHALELLDEYHLSHGEAVAIGMAVEGFMSVKMGHLPFEKWEEIITCLKAYEFPFVLSNPLHIETLKDVMQMDKKATGQRARFVLLNGIGSVHPFDGDYCSEVTDDALEESIAVMNELCATR